MAYKSHAFDVGDIIVARPNKSGTNNHILILDVLPEPAKYATMILETGRIIKGCWYQKKFFQKVA